MIIPCLKSMLCSPLTYVAVLGIVSDGFSFGSCETTLPAALVDWDDGGKLPVLKSSLIYSIGPLTFTIVAPLVCLLVDRTAHYKVLLSGLLLYTIFFPFLHLLDDSLVGLGAAISLSFGIAAVCEVAIYPFIADIAELTGITHADTIGYALNELFIQGGYAIGNVGGRALFDAGGFLMMGIFVASWDSVAFLTSVALLLMINRKKAKNLKSQLPLDTVDISNSSKNVET